MPDVLVTGIFSAAGNPLTLWQRNPAVTPDLDPKTCYYTHFDLSSENLGQTKRYNCWGFTFVPRRYWLDRSAVDTILADNCVPVADGSLEVGDVIRYQLNGVTTHTGRIWETDGAGHANLIRSKWGSMAEYLHIPTNVPVSYGTERAYFRQTAPLRGDPAETNKIADLWIKDSPTDNGEQGMRAPWWSSPDILVDVPPYDGAPDLNPVFSNVNRVWAVVRNRANQQIDNVYVRFYWADPAAGLPAASWNLIPATPGHPNAVGPISIAGSSSVQTDYVEWTPTAAPAHQCLLAIAYVNDNPDDSNNPDPLVYPFEIPWDNGIGQRNVHIVELENGGNGKVSIQLGNPFLPAKKFQGAVTALLTAAPAHPLLGFPREIVPLKVSMGFKKARIGNLKPWTSIREKGAFCPEEVFPREQILAARDVSLTLGAKERRHLDVAIEVPKNVPLGSHYFVHIVQTVAGRVTGGYTIGVVVGPVRVIPLKTATVAETQPPAHRRQKPAT